MFNPKENKKERFKNLNKTKKNLKLSKSLINIKTIIFKF